MISIRKITLALLVLVGMQSNASAELIWGVTDNQFLVNFESGSPTEILFGTAISGLQSNETLLGIDWRPVDGGFYAVGSSHRLYSLALSGAAIQIGSAFSIPLNGSSFGFDFDPTADTGLIVTNTNNKTRVSLAQDRTIISDRQFSGVSDRLLFAS